MQLDAQRMKRRTNAGSVLLRTECLVDWLQMKLHDLATLSDQLAATSSRKAKIQAIAECFCQLSGDEIEIATAFISGEIRQGRIGIGPSTLGCLDTEAGDDRSGISLAEVDQALELIATTRGAGSITRRKALLESLLGRATDSERGFLVRLLLGEIRQGALDGVVAEAIAKALDVPPGLVRRAYMIGGDLPAVASAAQQGGAKRLESFRLRLAQPVRPMLAQGADDVQSAITALGEACLEYKLDGARVQVHKDGDRIMVFSRALNDVTVSVPEIVELVRTLSPRSLVLDGEAIALRSDGRPHRFQTTMRRFGRRLQVATVRSELPLSAYFFDCLHMDGEDLIDRPTAERQEALDAVLPAQALVPRLVTGDPRQAEDFLARALAGGHEGVMAKNIGAPYEAGNRGSAWLKIKPVHTLDLVVLAAEWGSGRRRGWLSNLHLGARDEVTGDFVMLGKTFKGLTDATLRWQTERLLSLETHREAHTVYVCPELVVEIAVNEIQSSPQYPAGLALRFARVKRYRPDKRPEEADTVNTVRTLHGMRSAT